MFGLYFVNGEMWQKRFPIGAYGHRFEDQWRKLNPYEPVFRASVSYLREI